MRLHPWGGTWERGSQGWSLGTRLPGVEPGNEAPRGGTWERDSQGWSLGMRLYITSNCSLFSQIAQMHNDNTCIFIAVLLAHNMVVLCICYGQGHT